MRVTLVVWRVTLLTLVALGTLVVAPSAKADVVGDLRDTLTDPLKLGKASNNILESVERMQLMLNQIGTLERTTNTDLTNRIDQVKEEVDKVIAAVDRNVDNLRQIITEAEKTIT